MKEISLNTKQKEAVYHFNGPLMILAGAGSGKTRVITHKIANLINNCNISPRNIMGVTFTNKAASEMKDRLIEMLGKGNIKGLILSTFHSLCSNILRKHAGVINYQANFSIYGESDQLSMIKQIILDLGYSKEQIDAYDVASIIGRAKNQLLFPEHVSENHSLGWDEAFIKIYKYYQNRLKAHQAMDFDDLILNTVYLLNNHKNIKDKLINQYKYILVDEYQDTNYAQFELLKLLTHDQSNITIVGDDDQSIYSWRGAESSNFLRFEKEYKNVNTIILDQNYRSTNTILKSANAIIQKNTNRKPKNLKSNKGTGDLIAYYECEEEEDEAFTIADIILSKKIREKIRYHNFAILYRTNYQSRPFETAFRERNIPYRIIGGISFYDRKEIKDLVAYLKLINNLEDDISLLRIVNYPKRGIGETSIESFRKHALNNKLSLFQAMGETSKIDELDIKAKARITEFVDLIDSFKKEFETNSLSSCLKRLV
ncbi:MAG: UvrD-helicase domain-containing protein, partial [Spirochaetota bacterium]|nr:UvrD-helicase domain-containing protein [Spirochaetota bacterium]